MRLYAANTIAILCEDYSTLLHSQPSRAQSVGSFGGRPRCYRSRLETRAKEHSVKPSQRVSRNLVATVKAIGRVFSHPSVDEPRDTSKLVPVYTRLILEFFTERRGANLRSVLVHI